MFVELPLFLLSGNIISFKIDFPKEISSKKQKFTNNDPPSFKSSEIIFSNNTYYIMYFVFSYDWHFIGELMGHNYK